MIILWICLFLVLWTVAAIAYFIHKLPDKSSHKKDPWYVWVFAAPVLLIAVICGRLMSK